MTHFDKLARTASASFSKALRSARTASDAVECVCGIELSADARNAADAAADGEADACNDSDMSVKGWGLMSLTVSHGHEAGIVKGAVDSAASPASPTIVPDAGASAVWDEASNNCFHTLSMTDSDGQHLKSVVMYVAAASQKGFPATLSFLSRGSLAHTAASSGRSVNWLSHRTSTSIEAGRERREAERSWLPDKSSRDSIKH